MPYDIDEHRHNFSVWAAARAAQRGFCDVGTLRKALQTCGIVEYLNTPTFDDIDVPGFDKLHREWCMAVIESLKKAGIRKVTFGRAAKLVAIYLKSVVVLGSRAETAFARIAHPPIDSILLRNISACDEVKSEHKSSWAKTKWTKLEAEHYYQLITQLRQTLGSDEPFWKLERFWTVTDDTDI